MERSIKKNAVLNVLRKCVSIVLPMISLPYVLRVLGNEEYGRHSFACTVVSYFALLSSYGISNYAIRECSAYRNDKARISGFASDMFTFNLLTSLLAYAGLIVSVLFSSFFSSYSLLIFISSLCMALTTVGMDWVNNVYEDFKYITVRYIIIQFVSLILIFVLVAKPDDVWKYTLISVLGAYGGNLINIVHIRKYVHIKINPKIDIKKYIKPLTILLINSIAVIIYVNSDITMLGYMTSDADVGIYSLSSRVYNALKHAINAAIIVTVPRLCFLNSDDQKYKNMLSSIFEILLLVVVPIATGVACLSDSIVAVVGGKDYLSGAAPLSILSVALIFALLSSILTNCVLIVKQKERICLLSTTISACSNVILNLYFIKKFGIIGAAITTVIAEMLNCFVQMIFSRGFLPRLNYVKTIVLSILGGSAVFLSHELMKYLIEGISIVDRLIEIACTTALSVIVYLLILYIGREKHFLELISNRAK